MDEKKEKYTTIPSTKEDKERSTGTPSNTSSENNNEQLDRTNTSEDAGVVNDGVIDNHGQRHNNRGRQQLLMKRIMTWLALSVASFYCLKTVFNMIFPILMRPRECDITLGYPKNMFPTSVQQGELDYASIGILRDRFGKDILGIHYPHCKVHYSQLKYTPCYEVPISDLKLSKATSNLLMTYSIMNTTEPIIHHHDKVPKDTPSVHMGGDRSEFSHRVPLPVLTGESIEPFPIEDQISTASNGTLHNTNSTEYRYLSFGDPYSRLSCANRKSPPERQFSPLLTENGSRYFSILASEIAVLSIKSLDKGVNLITKIMTEAQAKENNNGMLNIYLRFANDNNGYDNDQQHKILFTMGSNGRGAHITISRNNDYYHNQNPNLPFSSASSDTITCQLVVVVPNEYQEETQKLKHANGTVTTFINQGFAGPILFDILAREGMVHGHNLAFHKLRIKIGRGMIKLLDIRVAELTTAILDGNINVQKIKVSRSLASGVFRGSSIVRAVIHPDKICNKNEKYEIINMSAHNGYTHTDVTALEIHRDQLAANFYLYEEDETPNILPTQSDYVYYSGPNLIHVDEKKSTDIFKTGYLVQNNSGSTISVYNGAKYYPSPFRKCQFSYGYYND